MPDTTVVKTPLQGTGRQATHGQGGRFTGSTAGAGKPAGPGRKPGAGTAAGGGGAAGKPGPTPTGGGTGTGGGGGGGGGGARQQQAMQQAADLRAEAGGLRQQANQLDRQAQQLLTPRTRSGKPRKTSTKPRKTRQTGLQHHVSPRTQQAQHLQHEAAGLRHQATQLDNEAAHLLARGLYPDLTKSRSLDPRRHVASATSDLTYVSFPITKFSKTEDGDLVVTGKATDGSVDSDDQIVDPAWSAKALSDWLDSGGNVRVQHQALRDPAGKGLKVEIDRDGDTGHHVTALVVEPVAKRLVEKGILTAYSVGISRPVIKRDPTGKAAGGIVCGGHLAELSLVDRPANKNCGLVLAKSAGGSMELVSELVGDEDFIARAASEDTLLTKAGGTPAEAKPGTGPDTEAVDEPDVEKAAPQATADDGQDGDDGQGGDQAASGGDAKPEDDEGTDGDDAVSKADAAVRVAYRKAREDWLTREPSVKGAVGGTEYLQRRAAWMKWNSEGDTEGLNGTRDGAALWLAKQADHVMLGKRDFTAAEREQAADAGQSMPDGSFPIKNKGDLRNAIRLAGNAKNPDAARAHIKERAFALGLAAMIPDTWKDSGGKADEGKAEDVPEGLKTAGPGDDGDDTPPERDHDADGVGDEGTIGDLELAGGKKKAADGGGKPCPTCKGDGKIMGGKRDCPDCGGSGTMAAEKETPDPEVVKAGDKACKNCGKNYHSDAADKFCGNCGSKLPKASGKAARKDAERDTAILTLTDTVTKAVTDGLMTQAAADQIIASAVEAAMVKAARPLPADVAGAKPHREPDGAAVETLEHQAGMGTDPDRDRDKTPASVGPTMEGRPVATAGPSRKGEVTYSLARMHDALCAAYDGSDVLAAYPSLKTVTDAVDGSWFAGQATAAAVAGKAKKTARLTALVAAAQAVKAADPAAIEDGRALLHKAFTDMYPSEDIKPGDGIRPGSFQRPYLSAGHASEDAVHRGQGSVPPSTRTPEPEDFHRPLITEGHAAPSPGNNPPNNSARPTTGSARQYYTNSARDQARTALASMHDHIAASFPDLCPMATSKSVLPPDNGAGNIPVLTPVHSQGGIPTVGKNLPPAGAVLGASGLDQAALMQVIRDSITRHQARATEMAVTPQQIAQAVKAEIPAPLPAGLSAAEMKALLAEQISPLAERYETQLADLRKQFDEIAARPDPAMAPVRGALAKADLAQVVPVERRSLVDEANEASRRRATEEFGYRQYVEALTKSPDPGTRERAMSVLDKLATVPVPPVS